MRFVLGVVAALLAAPAAPVWAQRGDFGEVFLNGLVRDQPYVDATTLGMVCNVNGPDGYLSIRSGPGTDFKALRKLKRFAIVKFDTTEQRGRWVRVITAYREVSPQGGPHPYKSLDVQGWAHDGYLCDFIH